MKLRQPHQRNQSEFSPTEVLAADKPSEVAMETPQETEQPAIKRQPLRGLHDRLLRLTHAYWSKRRAAIPVTILVIVMTIGAVPLSRYALLGLLIQ